MTRAECLSEVAGSKCHGPLRAGLIAVGLALSAAVAGCGAVEQPGSGSETLAETKAALGSPACLSRAANEIRLHAILLLDDAARSNCTTASPCTTSDDIASFVVLANLAFASARVRFVFDPAIDFSELVNPDLNSNLFSDNSGGNWAAANAIAAGFPGQVVVFLRKVTPSNFAYPPMTGQTVPIDAPFPTAFAGVQPRFVAHDGVQSVARANAQNFSHELGHFLGLYHTHITWGNFYPAVPPNQGCPKNDGSACTPDEMNQAITNLQIARGPGALDGDLLADTPEDPGPLYWNTFGLDPATVASVTVNGVTYTPDRQNLMSYFGGFNLSPGQIATVQNSICDPSRAPLVSAPQARCRDVTLTTSATGCTATGLTTAQVDNGSFDPNGLPITLSLDRTGPFTVGTTPVTLTVSDGTFTTPCIANITVVDQTRPTITPPPKVVTTICTNDAIAVGVAISNDNCGTPVVTGQVIVSNGLVLTPPINVTAAGLAQIGPGTHVIRWIATDAGGNISTTTQTVVITAGMQTSGSFIVEDRGTVRVPSGAGAGVFNGGTGQTRVGFDAHSGGILSVGPVQVNDRAVVSGGVISGGALDISQFASVAGARASFAQVALPPLPALPAFPAPRGSDITVNSNQRRTLAAGSFPSVTVNSGGTLVLGTGDFFFTNLTINAASTVRATPTTRVFVRSFFTAGSPFLAPSGTAVQPIFLGYAGTSVQFNAVFDGTLVAPNAQVFMGTGAGLTFTGAFYAQSIDLRPASTLVCLTSAAAM
jgi:hypothetical protein